MNPGPEIGLYLDNTDFINGSKTSSSPLLIANLSDPNGINFINVGIGHEIIAILDGDASHPIILNDYFHQDIDRFESGVVRFLLSSLSNGRHTLRLKAWDMYNNPSEKEIYFFVAEYPTMLVNQVRNYPNPMQDHTTFEFSPDKNSGSLDVLIQVFSQDGLLMNTIQSVFQETNQSVISIPWDGTRVEVPGLAVVCTSTG